MKRAPGKPTQLTPEKIQEIEQAVFQAVQTHLNEQFYLLATALEKEAGYWYLRIFVERPGQGISLNECETISRTLDTVLEALSALKDLSYNLEISSPGLFRPLRQSREFEFYLGKPVRIEEPSTTPAAKPGKTKSAKSLAPTSITIAEGLLQGYDEANRQVTLKNASTEEVSTISLDENRLVLLNPVIRFPDEAQPAEASL